MLFVYQPNIIFLYANASNKCCWIEGGGKRLILRRYFRSFSFFNSLPRIYLARHSRCWSGV